MIVSVGWALFAATFSVLVIVYFDLRAARRRLETDRKLWSKEIERLEAQRNELLSICDNAIEFAANGKVLARDDAQKSRNALAYIRSGSHSDLLSSRRKKHVAYSRRSS